jgi:hypothetical protein
VPKKSDFIFLTRALFYVKGMHGLCLVNSILDENTLNEILTDFKPIDLENKVNEKSDILFI